MPLEGVTSVHEGIKVHQAYDQEAFVADEFDITDKKIDELMSEGATAQLAKDSQRSIKLYEEAFFGNTKLRELAESFF